MNKRKVVAFLIGLFFTSAGFTQTGLRKNITLNENWQSNADVLIKVMKNRALMTKPGKK